MGVRSKVVYVERSKGSGLQLCTGFWSVDETMSVSCGEAIWVLTFFLFVASE